MLVSQKLDTQDTFAVVDSVENLNIKWHLGREFLGVSSFIPGKGGFLSFYTKRAEKPFYLSTIQHNQFPNCIDWHPTETVLAVGWESGKVELVDPNKKTEIEVTDVGLDKVCCVKWNESGSILLAVDLAGSIRAFQFDSQQQKQLQPKPLNSAQIVDEIPTDVCPKLFDRKILDYSGNVDKRVNERGSAGERTAKLGEINGKDELTELLNKHKRFMEFEEEKQMISTKQTMHVNLVTVFLVKLSGRPDCFSMIRIDAGLIVLCYGEREIRVWDLQNEDSAILTLSTEKGYDTNDQIVCLSYSSKKDTISGATANGKVASWRRQQKTSGEIRGGGAEEVLAIDQQWRLQNALFLNSPISEMAWSPTSAALAINSGNSVEIFLSQGIEFFVDTEFAVVQVSPQILSLIKITDPVETQELQLHTNIRAIKSFQVQLDQIIFSNDSPLKIQTLSSFDIPVISTAIFYNQQIYIVDKDKLLINTIQGTLKKSVTFREIEGDPSTIDVNGKWMCIATTHGYLRIYDLSDDNFKLVFHSSHIGKSVKEFEKFASVKINCAGNRISFTIQQSNEEVNEKLFVWTLRLTQLVLNRVGGYFSFHSGITDQQQYESVEAEKTARKSKGGGERPKTAAERKIEQEISRYRMLFHLPGNHFWDRNDSRFLVCEANHVGSDNTANQLLSMFVTTEHSIQMHDLQPRPTKADCLIAVSVPFLFLLKNIENDDEDDIASERTISRLILRRTIREFVGMDFNNPQAIEAMLNFSFYLCVGQMDNAFKAIKFIKNESVWESMARMCVKTRRIDVARVCLGHMGNARAACALRHCLEKGESIELQTARLAIELGMIEEAIAIYTTANRYDIVNQVYQAQGKWSEAFEIAEKHDRIHLRNTHYNYAKYLESVGNIEAAIDNYEKANVHRFEVPRMLSDEPKALEFYIKRNADPALTKWWAQYLESTGDLEIAKNFYSNAGDYLSVVRILCYTERIQEASELVSQMDDKAAAFHLARHLETLEDFENAVKYFSKASAYGSAIRLAKEHDMTDKLANLALLVGGRELIDVAQYYEELPGHADKAVMLYHKAGMIGRALDLAFKTEQFTALDLIAQDLNEKSDPRVLERAAQFFSNNQQDQMAVQLLAYAKKYSEAVALCSQKHVTITEELDNLLTPSKTEKGAMASNRTKLLEEIARCCLQQGNYHFAAKKFTQAGNKLEAMRALLKSGDTPKIILFANTAKNKDIYRMAGNYLQTLNWKEDANLMRQVENFYLKADSLDLLANFYEACAQVEIDDYRDYEKGIAAYSEALRCLNKKIDKESGGTSSTFLADRQDELREALEKIKRFLAAKLLYESDPGEALRQLNAMTEEKDINEVVRLGDIFAIIVAHNMKRGNFRKAWQVIEQCERRQPKVDMRQHLSSPILDQICDEAGVPRLTLLNQNNNNQREEEEDEEEATIEYSHAMKRRISNLSNEHV
uniref:Anaphase-promoting complex subunit 4-like WD40 domain-containing protein n=1 Tax=Ditylenchus dipsaci TaxID=166011 RepID=A0A915CSH0_9BILA